MPLITVCIVVLNGRAHISDAISSVLEQSYSEIELLVIDGGSTDGTLNILKEYGDRITRLVSEPDAGIYDAMNKACALAHGDWLIFLGFDDMMLDSLSTVASNLVDDATVYYGDVIVRSTGRVFGGYFSKYRLMQVNICHQAIFYPRKIYKTHQYSLQYRFLADYEYNLRLIGSGVKFQYMNITVSIFNIEGASMAGDPEFERDRLRLIREHFGHTFTAVKRLRNVSIYAIRLLRRLSWRTA